MPKRAKELSAAEVRRLSHAVSADGNVYTALHAVGGVAGLQLQVSPTGAKSWILRTVTGTKRRSIGLGAFPAVSLAQARQKAQAKKEQIAAGIDPVEEQRAARRALIAIQMSAITFDDAARRYIKEKSKEFKNPRQRQQWENSLATYASPVIGKVPVREIGLSHIKQVLEPIWDTKTETASRVRARIENILGWSAVHGYRSEENPARWSGYLDKVLASPEKIRNRAHHAALPLQEMQGFMTDLKRRTGTAARALEFLILTASRTNEVIGDKRIGKLGVTWGEIDMQRALWTVPGSRMKSGKEHKVPLSNAAVAFLESLPEGEAGELIFAGPKGEIASNNFLSSVLKRMGIKATAHGFRSVFKDWAREHTSYADEISELALAHINSDATRAAYARSELIEKRRKLMNEWELFCTHGLPKSQGRNVVKIGRGKA